MRVLDSLTSVLFAVIGIGAVLFVVQTVLMYGAYALDTGFESTTMGDAWLAIYGPGLSAGGGIMERFLETTAPEIATLESAITTGGDSLKLLLLGIGVYSAAAGLAYSLYRLWKPAR
jgi:hypothetical protein